MTANIITLVRMCLTFTVIILLDKNLYTDIAFIATIPLIFGLDAVDGYIARKYNQTNILGAVVDIAADRIIENVFWIYFVVNDIIHFWMPIAVLTRGFTTDAIRSFAISNDKPPFEMMTRKWTRTLTSSRISRFISGASKMCAFCAMAFLHMLRNYELFPQHLETIQTGTHILATSAFVICLLRGVPVIVDGITHIQLAHINHTPTAKHHSNLKEI